MKMGARCRFEKVRVRQASQIDVGARNAFTEGCWLWPLDGAYNRDVMIDARGLVKIGDHNMFGPQVYITDSDHTMMPDRWIANCPMKVEDVVIGNGCWIGAGAKILKGFHLGDRCVVGAGAVVTRSFPSGSFVVGVPARIVVPRPVAEAGSNA